MSALVLPGCNAGSQSASAVILSASRGLDLIASMLSRAGGAGQARRTLAARRYSVGAMQTVAAKKRVNPLCDEKPRSKPMSAIDASVATSESRAFSISSVLEKRRGGTAHLY